MSSFLGASAKEDFEDEELELGKHSMDLMGEHSMFLVDEDGAAVAMDDEKETRARKKRNEAMDVVGELFRLHELGKPGIESREEDDREELRNKAERSKGKYGTKEELYAGLRALVKNVSIECEKSNMVQMWVPRIAGKSVVMTTHKELCKITAKKQHDAILMKKFSENSTAFFFNCEAKSSGEGLLGLPGRCYVLSRPEFTPSVTSYRPLEYVRVSCAYECRIHTTMCLPVFLSEKASMTERPFMILEIALCHMTESIGELYVNVVQEFLKLGLYTTGHDRIGPERYMKKFVEATSEILDPGHSIALKLMCDTLHIPMVQFWIECNGILVTAGCPYYLKTDEFKDIGAYRDMSSQISLMKGQGPVGQAHLKETFIWVDDVQKASQIEWPLHHTSLLLSLRGLCACKMRIGCILPDGTKKKTEAILEIVLDPKLQTSEQQMKIVEGIWSYLQKGMHLGDQVMNNDDDNNANNNNNNINSNDINVNVHNNISNNNNSKKDSVPLEEQLVPPPAETRTPIEHVFMVNMDQDEMNKSAPWGITLELLQTQFSKHLKDAANDLGIGSTTLKRICRQYGIARWPRRSLKSKQYKEVKEEVKRQKKEVKLSQARSGGGGSSMRGGSSFRSSGWSGSDEAVEGKSVHGGQAGGKESLFGQANVAVVNSKSGQQLGANELFTMGYTGALLEMGGSGDDGNHEEEGRAHGGFRFAGIRDIATRQFDFDEDDEPDRGASWHAGSGFVATGRLNNKNGQLVASTSVGEDLGTIGEHLGFGFGKNDIFPMDGSNKKMTIAPAIQQPGDFGRMNYPTSGGIKIATNAPIQPKSLAKATADAKFSFDDHFYETIHGAHNFSKQFGNHLNDNSVHGSTYTEATHAGSMYGDGSTPRGIGGDHSVHGTTALAGILNSTLGAFGDDFLNDSNDATGSMLQNSILNNDENNDDAADMIAVLLEENINDDVDEVVPFLAVKLRVGDDTIRFRLLHKWSVQILLDRIQKLFVFPNSAKLKYLDDEDDMCILQTEHDLEECVKFSETRKKESGNSGNNENSITDIADDSNNNNNSRSEKTSIMPTIAGDFSKNGGGITIFASLKDGSMPSLNRYETVKQDAHAIPPSHKASINAGKDQFAIKVKISHGQDMCRFVLEPKMDFAMLIEHVAKLFAIENNNKNENRSLKLKYLDDYEEWIVLNGDLDLDECRALMSGITPNLRMKIHEM